MENHAITHQAYSAFSILTRFVVINPITVADIETVLAAIAPDRVLDEPGKDLRKRWIELPGIDPLGDGLNDVGAAAGLVAGKAKEDDRWILVLDSKLNRSPFITHIVLAWKIPPNRLLVLGRCSLSQHSSGRTSEVRDRA
jgi:hypothetical protein